MYDNRQILLDMEFWLQWKIKGKRGVPLKNQGNDGDSNEKSREWWVLQWKIKGMRGPPMKNQGNEGDSNEKSKSTMKINL